MAQITADPGTSMLDIWRLAMTPALAGAIMSETLRRPVSAHALPGGIAHLGIEGDGRTRHYLLPVGGASRAERDALDGICVRRVHTHVAGDAFLIPDPDTVCGPGAWRGGGCPRPAALEGLLAHLRHAAGPPAWPRRAAGG